MNHDPASTPDFLSDITKLTPKYAISPCYIFEYAQKNGDLGSIMSAKKDASGRMQTVQELLITALLVATKKRSFHQQRIYISPFEGDRPDTSVYTVDLKNGKCSRKLCEITVRTAWPSADDIKTLIQKKIKKEYPDCTAVVVYIDTDAEPINFLDLHQLVQDYGTPYDIFLIYGTTRRSLEGIVEETDINLSSYSMDEMLTFCVQINKITEHGEATLRIPVDVARCGIGENELKYDPPFMRVDGNKAILPLSFL